MNMKRLIKSKTDFGKSDDPNRDFPLWEALEVAIECLEEKGYGEIDRAALAALKAHRDTVLRPLQKLEELKRQVRFL